MMLGSAKLLIRRIHLGVLLAMKKLLVTVARMMFGGRVMLIGGKVLSAVHLAVGRMAT